MKRPAWTVAAVTAVAVIALAIGTADATPDHHHPEAASRRVATVRHLSHQGFGLDGINEAVIRQQWERDQLFALKARQEAAARARAAAAKPSPSVSSNRRPGGVNWDGIARCETGGNWQHQTRYDGGLGILHAAWIEFGGREFAEYGSQATREQQIIVAERIYAKYGLSGWGCKAYG